MGVDWTSSLTWEYVCARMYALYHLVRVYLELVREVSTEYCLLVCLFFLVSRCTKRYFVFVSLFVCVTFQVLLIFGHFIYSSFFLKSSFNSGLLLYISWIILFFTFFLPLLSYFYAFLFSFISISVNPFSTYSRPFSLSLGILSFISFVFLSQTSFFIWSSFFPLFLPFNSILFHPFFSLPASLPFA